jgi:outer membrane immunogenic protein
MVVADRTAANEVGLVLLNRAGTFLVAALAAACLTQAAGATELTNLPTPPQQSQAPQKPEWAGFYLKTNPTDGSAIPWTAAGGSTAFTTTAPTAGPVNENFGYNFQSGNFVFGLEGALAAANFDGRFTSPNFAPTGGWSPNMNWFGSVTGRLGYSFGQWLPYIKGGFATAEVGSPLQGAPTGTFSQGPEVSGWTAGLGFEYQISPKWSLGLEYLYTDLGGGSGAPNALGGAPITGSPEMYSTALKTQSLLGRLNFKPGW